MIRRSIGKNYPPDWPGIAKAVKDNAGWCCERCGAPHQKGQVLTVHHLDMQPSNCTWWNLAALCQQCHLHIQHKVIMEQIYIFEHTEWFKPHVAGYYAHLRGLPDDKDYVSANLEDLLDFTKLEQP